jgi:DNA-binding CsgD family transcriptional regulator
MGGAAAMEPLLERSEELARIESALTDARAGREVPGRRRARPESARRRCSPPHAALRQTQACVCFARAATGARPRRIVLRGLDSLTASERRVAELASQDLTNREIAQSLFITSRRSKGHLTSVFRKLQLTSRDELPVALAVDAPVSA